MVTGNVRKKSDDEVAARSFFDRQVAAQAPRCDSGSEGNARPKPPTGLLLRGGIVPMPLLAEVIRSGATVSVVKCSRQGRGLSPSTNVCR